MIPVLYLKWYPVYLPSFPKFEPVVVVELHLLLADMSLGVVVMSYNSKNL